MTEWQEHILEDVVERFIDYRGKTPPKTDAGIPLVTAKIVKNGGIQTPNEFISEEIYDQWMTRGFPKRNDVVLTTEAPLGEVALLKDENVALAQRIILMRGKPSVLNNGFLKYYFQSREGQHLLQSRASGTTVFGIKAAVLKKIPVPVPPLLEQEAITAVLSSLDDKIDLLHRQNKTLESLAQTLLRHWFIDNEDAIRYSYEDLVDTVSIKHKFDKEQVIFLNTSDIYDGQVLHQIYSDVHTLPGQAKKSIRKGDILFTEIRPANRRLAYIDFDAHDYVVSTKLMVLRSKGVISRAILYFYLKRQGTLDWLQMLAEGRSGTFPQITFDHLKSLDIEVLKDRELLENVSQLFDSILEKTFQNYRQIRTLEKLRNTLLPKLMSGEVRVRL